MKSTLDDPQFRNILKQLHSESRKDFWRFSKFGLFVLRDLISGKSRIFSKDVSVKSKAFKDIYISISEYEGRFLYFIARSIHAKNIIEFGTSFGISSIYLGAAIKDNWGGKLITTEIEEEKVIRAAENIKMANLDNIVEIRHGDAINTLKTVEIEIDMLFLDGWKKLYLPLVKILSKYLRQNAIVLADDVIRFKKSLLEYSQYIKDPSNGFISTTLSIGDGIEYSIQS